MLFRIELRDLLRAVIFAVLIDCLLPNLGGFSIKGGLGLAAILGVVTAALYLVGASAVCWLARRLCQSDAGSGSVTLLGFFVLNGLGAALLMAFAAAVPTLFTVANWGAALGGGFMLSAAATLCAINERRK